jgi:HAD superfamily hydrolase (TIGR01458 family)
MIRGLLIDIDGVLTIDGRTVEGAPEAIERLGRMGIPFRILTNSTVRPRSAIVERLARAGFRIDADRISTPAGVARRELAGLGDPPTALYAVPRLQEDFEGANLTRSRDARIVILGDLGERFDYEVLQEIFERLLEGAELWALHKSAFWLQGGKLRMDLGAFVSALEFASGRPARVLGKPGREAFLLAAAELGAPPGEVVMVGDDLRGDVGGAQAAGLSGILVRTGKCRDGLVAEPGIVPDAILDSIADLPAWLERTGPEEGH